MRVALALLFLPLCFFSLDVVSAPTTENALEEVTVTVDQLETLAAKGSWSEAVFRLRDVPPGARGKKWDALVEKVSAGYLSALSLAGGSGTELVASQLLKEHPSLQRSQLFLRTRKEIGLRAFEACFDRVYDDQDCSGRFLAYVEETPGDMAFALQAAELVSRKEAPAASLPFRAVAIRWATPARICKEAGTRRAILAALHLPEGPLLEMGRELASKTCAKEAKEEIDTEFTKAKKGSFIANACGVFKARGDGPPSAAARCAPFGATAPKKKL